ncbi:MAG: SDR family oxidoreductase [Chlamydiota bacterium]
MNPSKVVIVTGGGKGIGAGIVRRLLSEQMRVVIAEISLEHKKDFSAEDPSHLLFVKTDIRSEASIKAMIQKAIRHFGRIDAIVNNAGIMPKDAPIEKMALKTWNDFIATNLTGAFLCTKHAIPHLRKQKGAIINIASTRALQSEGYDAPYSASKGGLVALTHALAVSLGPEIRVHCISPGWIHTDKTRLKKADHAQHPAGRVGKPEDVANLVSFLITGPSEFMTGQNFVVDGGMTIKMTYRD